MRGEEDFSLVVRLSGAAGYQEVLQFRTSMVGMGNANLLVGTGSSRGAHDLILSCAKCESGAKGVTVRFAYDGKQYGPVEARLPAKGGASKSYV